MSVTIDTYTRGNLSLVNDGKSYVVMYKENPLFLELKDVTCCRYESGNPLDGITSTLLPSKEQLNILDDVYSFCDTYLIMRKQSMTSLLLNGETNNLIKIHNGISAINNNIPHKGYFGGDVIVTFELKSNEKNKILSKTQEDFSCHIKVDNMVFRKIDKFIVGKNLVNIFNIEMKNIDILYKCKKQICYNGDKFRVYIPDIQFTIFKNGQICGNLLLDSTPEIVAILRSIKRCIKLLIHRDINMETFVINADTHKYGDFSMYHHRCNVNASLICEFVLEEKLMMYVEVLQINGSWDLLM